VSLTLIAGPANAAKAAVVLDGVRAAAPRDPLLVVPTAADVRHYGRELAGSGVVFGVAVVSFSGLIREIARACGVSGAPLGPVARERVVASAVAAAGLRTMAASARSPGFARAAGRFVGELREERVGAARLGRALETWADQDRPARAGHARDVAALYASYEQRLGSARRTDRPGHDWAVLDALRLAPTSWPARPVFLYGFDDLSTVQLDAVETLGEIAGAEVVVGLTQEPGRVAFAGRAAVFERLVALAGPDRVQVLSPAAEHYEPASRAALHHLERNLFEEQGPSADAGGAIRILESGGERAELELVAAEALALVRAGVDAAEIAIVFRSPEASADLAVSVLEAHGLPVAAPRLEPLARTALGAAWLAGARVALGAGAPGDLVAWLRAPGHGPEAAVDALEAELLCRRVGERGARAWFEHAPGGRELAELDAIAAAAAVGPDELLEALRAELRRLWTEPLRRRAAELSGPSGQDARVAADAERALDELGALAPGLVPPGPALLEALGEVRVRAGQEDAGARGVLVCDPLAIRARRFRAVFVCGLQEGGFPLAPAPEPFLDDERRRELALCSGLRLAPREATLARERFLLNACATRPTERLFLSWRSSDEDGDPQAPSPFLEDVRALFGPELDRTKATRLLADVTWSPEQAPTALERRRALAARGPRAEEPPALAPPASAAALEILDGRRDHAAGALERFARCGVAWLVDHALKARALQPDPEPMRRGQLMHDVLERTLSALRARTGSARLHPGSLAEAERAGREAVAVVAPAAPGDAEALALARAIEGNLLRYLRFEARAGAGAAGWSPARLEWSFGGAGDVDGPLELEGLRIRGRVDRVDLDPGGTRAIVRDYKGSTVTPGAKWVQQRRLQLPLYLLAVRELLGLEPVAGLYQPMTGSEPRGRGLVLKGSGAGGPREQAVFDTDSFEAEPFAQLLTELAELAAGSARALRAADTRPCPDRCSAKDGCAHPAICRVLTAT